MRPVVAAAASLLFCFPLTIFARAQVRFESLTASALSAPMGGTVTYTIAVTNAGPGSTDAAAQLLLPADGYDSLELHAPAGWTAAGPTNLGGTTQVSFQNEGFAPGRTALRVSVRLTLNTPGAAFTVFGCVSPAGCESATVTIAGAASLPSSTPALEVFGRVAVPLAGVTGHDIAIDPIGPRFLLTGSTHATQPGASSLQSLPFDTAGAPTGNLVDVDTSSASRRVPRLEFSPDLGGIGGYLVVWIDETGEQAPHHLRTRTLSSSGALTSGLNTLQSLATSNLDPSLAYSTTSRSFLVTWSACQQQNCTMFGWRLGLAGEPLGGVFEIGRGRFGQVVWNPVAGEFGVVFEAIPSGDVSLVRISGHGAVLGRTTVAPGTSGKFPHVAVNSDTGSYVAVWTWQNSMFGAEINAAGTVQSRGIVSNRLAVLASVASAIAYNAISQTFFVAGTETNSLLPFAGSVTVGVELNRYGAPLSLPMGISVFDTEPTVIARSDAPEWRIASRTSSQQLRIDAVRTMTRDGGSSLRLGGCTTPDPFTAIGGGNCYGGGWLPPGLPPPGSSPVPPPVGCTTPDPFAAIGGGTCRDGGWFPPGMLSPEPVAMGAPVPGGCTTPDPFVAIGGGVCYNGGWRPGG